jgi:hypothetical protein
MSAASSRWARRGVKRRRLRIGSALRCVGRMERIVRIRTGCGSAVTSAHSLATGSCAYFACLALLLILLLISLIRRIRWRVAGCVARLSGVVRLTGELRRDVALRVVARVLLRGETSEAIARSEYAVDTWHARAHQHEYSSAHLDVVCRTCCGCCCCALNTIGCCCC